jgi:hypothetical protein
VDLVDLVRVDIRPAQVVAPVADRVKVDMPVAPVAVSAPVAVPVVPVAALVAVPVVPGLVGVRVGNVAHRAVPGVVAVVVIKTSCNLSS